MTFCISANFFHPNWDADIDYDAIVLPTKTVVLMITDPYDYLLSSARESIVFRLNEEEYQGLEDAEYGETLCIECIQSVFNGENPRNILNENHKNKGEHLRNGYSFYGQNAVDYLIDNILDRVSPIDRFYLENWRGGNDQTVALLKTYFDGYQERIKYEILKRSAEKIKKVWLEYYYSKPETITKLAERFYRRNIQI